MSGRFRATLPFLVALAGVTLLLSAGMTNAYGSGTRLRANDGVWFPDGANADTFWDAPIVDLPGLSVYAVHCHGRMRADFQLGATGPSHSNPCYAAMGMYSGGGQQSGLYLMLPGGNTAVYRESVNYGPWTYSIGDVIYYSSPPGSP
jgi:hypothetical protein